MKDESILDRLSTIEAQMKMCLPAIQKIPALENDMLHFKEDITEIKVMQEKGSKDRQKHYESLTQLIQDNQKATMERIDPLATQIAKQNTVYSTIVWLLTGLGGTLTVIATVYMAWPK